LLRNMRMAASTISPMPSGLRSGRALSIAAVR
jgi:hypothetical protein